jgi:putative transposase
MPRLARLVFPGVAHYVAQRAAEGREAFPTDADRAEYVRLLAEAGKRHGLAFWCWCLLPDRVDLLAIPKRRKSLAAALAEAHWRYAFQANRRGAARGRRFHGRFQSFPVEPGEPLIAAAYRVEFRPRETVRGLVKAIFWPWSSAAFNAGRLESDPLVEPDNPFRHLAGVWRRILLQNLGPAPELHVAWHLGNGTAMGDWDWAAGMSSLAGMRPDNNWLLRRHALWRMLPAIRECYQQTRRKKPKRK